MQARFYEGALQKLSTNVANVFQCAQGHTKTRVFLDPTVSLPASTMSRRGSCDLDSQGCTCLFPASSLAYSLGYRHHLLGATFAVVLAKIA